MNNLIELSLPFTVKSRIDLIKLRALLIHSKPTWQPACNALAPFRPLQRPDLASGPGPVLTGYRQNRKESFSRVPESGKFFFSPFFFPTLNSFITPSASAPLRQNSVKCMQISPSATSFILYLSNLISTIDRWIDRWIDDGR